MTTKLTQPAIDEDILSTICELFEAFGAQSFNEILHEVRTQSVNAITRKEAINQVEKHLVYLIELGSVKKQDDEFGIVYGLPSDFG